MTLFLSFTHSTNIPVKASDDPARQQIISVARLLCGTPFRHQGRQIGVGLDCIGVVALTAQAVGLCPPVPQNYSRVPLDGRLLDGMARAGLVPRALAQARMGDILVMRFHKLPQHLGLLTDRGILHAWQGAGAVVEHGLSPHWQKRVVAVFSFPGVN